MVRITATADFDTQEEATKALAAIEEAIGRNDGELQYADVEDADDLYVDNEPSPDPGWMLD